MALLPAGKAGVAIKAGQYLEVERTDADGTKWLRPLSIGITVSATPIESNYQELLVRLVVRTNNDYAIRNIGAAIHSANVGEDVFVN